MAAQVPLREKVTGAVPFLVPVGYGIAAVFAAELSSKLLKFDAVRLLRVTPGFLDLTDKAGMHYVFA